MNFGIAPAIELLLKDLSVRDIILFDTGKMSGDLSDSGKKII